MMRHRLFPNIKRLTSIFCAAIILLTAAILVSRLTFLSGMAAPVSSVVEASSGGESGAAPGEDADYLINTKIQFDDPSAKGNMLISNTENNDNYIRVDIKLNSTGKSVYYSGNIAPGTSIASASLHSGPEEEGVYECTATIAAYDAKTMEKIGEDEVPVTLYIGVKPE